jgi:YfiH family protein
MRCGIRHPLLEQAGVTHCFGLRTTPLPLGLLRPRQVHGRQVAEPDLDGNLRPEEADAVVSAVPGLAVGIATADCVPILACTRSGQVVAAIHAGWRGLAAGVVRAGISALRVRAAAGEALVAVIGPHIGPCCYEVDEPVRRALRRRFGDELMPALRATRPGHALLDLSRLVTAELAREGLTPECRGTVADSCTRCNADLFHSYRRDGVRAGRLVHYAVASASTSGAL